MIEISPDELTNSQMIRIMFRTIMEVHQNMSKLSDRVDELTAAVADVKVRVNALNTSDVPALRAALEAAQTASATLTETLTSERAADVTEDAAYEARLAELASNVQAAVNDADAAVARIGEQITSLGEVAPASA